MLQWGRDQLIAESICSIRLSPPSRQLQWGRDQLIAESGVGTRMVLDIAMLQWGRDQLIAESVGTMRRTGRLMCFNGAAIN